jgi:hypothetical protein
VARWCAVSPTVRRWVEVVQWTPTRIYSKISKS